jgi:uncharacterized protein YqkB
MDRDGLAAIWVVTEGCSCEGLAKFVYRLADEWLPQYQKEMGVSVKHVICREDTKNSATYSKL